MSTLGGAVTHFTMLNVTVREEDRKYISYAVNGLDQDIKYDLYLEANDIVISHNYTLGM